MVDHADENDIKHQVSLDIMDMVLAETGNVPALRSGMELVTGIIVRSVRWGGVADQAGVAAGDVISEVNGIPVRTLNDLERILQAHTGSEPFRFLFRRVRAWRYLALPCDVPRLATVSQGRINLNVIEEQ